MPLKHVELVNTCDVESNFVGSISSCNSSAYGMANFNSYHEAAAKEPENVIEKEENSDDDILLLPGRPEDNLKERALSIKENGLLIDIYNIERFAKKCKKAYEYF